MLFVPKTIAKPLTEKLLYPEERSRLIKKMVDVIHTGSFIPTVQETGKQRERIKEHEPMYCRHLGLWVLLVEVQ